jgi:Dolichyl-phosphate-mannose-protein mannosyltransferase
LTRFLKDHTILVFESPAPFSASVPKASENRRDRAVKEPAALPDDVRRPRLWLAALLAAALALCATGIWWGMPHSVGWSGDEMHPSSWPQALSLQTYRGWHSRYPPLHFAVLQALSWPLRLALDAAGASPYWRTVWLIFFSRGISLLLALATLALVFRTGSEIYDRRSALCAAAIVMCCAPFVYYAKMGNLDVPYLFWFALSLLLYVRILKRHLLRDYVLFALAAAAAVCTKDQAYGLYSLAPLPILWSLARREHRERSVFNGLGRALLDRRFLAAAAAAALGFAVFQMLWNWNRFVLHVQLLLGPMSQNYQDYGNTFAGHRELLGLLLRETSFCLNPALALVCACGVVWTLWRLWKRAARQTACDEPFLIASLLLLIVSYYVTFLNLILFSYDRYILPVALLLAFPGGRLLGALSAPAGRFVALRRAAVAALLVYSLLYAASVDTRLLADSRYAVEAWVRQHAPSAQAAESAVGIGRRKHIPRFRWMPWELVFHSHGAALARQRPLYVAINVTDLRTPGEVNFYHRMLGGELGYRLVLFCHGDPLFDLLRVDVLGSSSERFINPEIALFERSGV